MEGPNPDLSRRSLLLGRGVARTGPKVAPRRPPWSLPEALFSAACTSCNACIAECPEGILTADGAGRPLVDFMRGTGACTFCGVCATACGSAAAAAGIPPAFLADEMRAATPPWRLRALVAETCLTCSGIMCQSCKDACDAGAIRFSYAAGRVARPMIDGEACTGCGACQAPCPAGAISFHARESADA